MAEAILFNVAASIITKLGSPALQQAKKWWDVNDELAKLKATVVTIQAVLLDAEKQYSQSHQVKAWVDSLKQVFYDADDLLDEFSTKALQEQVMTGNKMVKEVRLLFSSSNPLAYSLKMAHKIKQIASKLDAIAKNKNFHLDERLNQNTFVFSGEREQTHSSLPKIVIGREEDKKKIIEFLLSSNYGENVSIISIVGIGGVGKTTLAQLVCDDETVKSNFKLRLWVCISDNFDVKAIVEKILESIGEKPAGNREMNTLKNILHEKINGVKYLLVLDDVWNENYEKWFHLKDLLDGGANGSKIIVTTRLKNVAEGIRSNSMHELRGLLETESWSLFANMAFKQGKLISQEHELVGKEIVAKCHGVPLAIRVIGRLLYLKNTIYEWKFFKDKEFSNVHHEDASILSTLKLSYNHLPSHLKYCFAYCSLFPKDHIFRVRFLVHQWVGQGFIKSLDNSKQDLEDIGLEYFKELLWRSFFQEVKGDSLGNIQTCKMHDLMYDLAVLVAGKETTILNSNVCVDEVTRHLSLELRDSSCKQLACLSASARKVRTVLLHNMSGQLEIKEEELHAIFFNLKRLRVLDLSYLNIKRVPPSVDKLKHLRYLNLSYNKSIEVLPDSICKLQNLQMLGLIKCERLKQLPKHFKLLVNLRQLYIGGCVSLTHMPPGLGQLTSLRNLPLFIVAKDNGISKQSGGLDELHDLNNLRRNLRICNLRYVKNATSEFEAANLKEKQHLQSLTLEWVLGRSDDNTNSDPNEVDNDNEEISLEELRPHLNLKMLLLYGCGRVKFPSWVPSLANLVRLTIDDCKKCQRFPPLDKFSSLKHLGMQNLTDLEYIESENQMSGAELFFHSLEYLWVSNCPNLKGWLRPELLQFHCLFYLDIRSCPNLTSMPLIPSVETLAVQNVSMKSLEDILKMKISVSQSNSSSSSSSSSSLLSPTVSQLKILAIKKIEDLEFLAEELMQNLTSLQKLDIVDCPKITTLPRALRHLTSLKVLLISDCHELDFSDENESGIMQWECLRSLEVIQFEYMAKLISLPKGLQRVPTLRNLIIISCPNLMCLPEWMPNLTTLRLLGIRNCPQLSGRCSSNMGVDWPKIAYIPYIDINGRYIQYDGCYKL